MEEDATFVKTTTKDDEIEELKYETEKDNFKHILKVLKIDND